MMRKFLGLVLAMFVGTTVHPSAAQQQDKVFRLGYLTTAEPAADAARAGAIRAALRALGYVEGQNIVIEYRSSQGLTARLPELAADLVRFKVDLIIAAGGDGVIVAAKNATTTIPVVMVGQGSDPVEAGIIASLAHPGGNVTGMTNLLVQLGGKRLELLKDAVPKLAHVAIPYIPGNRTHGLELKSAEGAARALGVSVQRWEVGSAKDFDKVFTALTKQRPDGLHVLGGPLMRDERKRIIDFTLKSRLPAVFEGSPAVSAGGLMSYGADLSDTYPRVAWYVDKLLKGTKPTDLPVQQPTKFEFVINLKTAKQIGLTIPPNVLARADRVIK